MNPPVIALQTKPARETVSRLLGRFVSIAILLAGAVAYLFGMLFNYLFGLMLLAVPVTICARVWALIRRRLELTFVRRPFTRVMRGQLLQFLNRWLYWGLLAVTVVLAAPESAFEPGEYHGFLIGFVCLPAALLLTLQLFPHQQVSRSRNLVLPYSDLEAEE